MIQLSAPHAIGEHVYFLLDNTITEGITIACTVKFDGFGHNVVYEVGYWQPTEGPAKAVVHQDDLYARRADLVNSLLHNCETLEPDQSTELAHFYHVVENLCTDAAAEPETETEATLGSVMAEVAQQWRKQLDEQPNPETVEL